MGEVARLRNESTAQTLIWLIAEADRYDEQHPDAKGNTESIMGKSMLETDIANFLAWPHTNICSHGDQDSHLRGNSAFPRVLAKYVQEQKLRSLEAAIQKMTTPCSECTGIQERGQMTNSSPTSCSSTLPP